VNQHSVTLSPIVAIDFDDAKARAIMRFRGKVDMQAMNDFYLHAPGGVYQWMERLGLDAYDCLVDMREAKLGFKMSDIKQVVQLNNDVPPERREAVVASSDLIYGLARLYQILQPRRSIFIFRDMASAESWLDA